jgi:hypothetical protein
MKGPVNLPVLTTKGHEISRRGEVCFVCFLANSWFWKMELDR